MEIWIGMESGISSSTLINLSLYKSQLPKFFGHLIKDNLLKANKGGYLTECCLKDALVQDNPAVLHGMELFAEVVVGISKINQRLLELKAQRKILEEELAHLMEQERLKAQQGKDEVDEDDEDY